MTIDDAFKIIEKELNLMLPYQIGHLTQIKMGYVQSSIFDRG